MKCRSLFSQKEDNILIVELRNSYEIGSDMAQLHHDHLSKLCESIDVDNDI